ncbi:hypothetical protein PR048_008154 [Dryococelus australis]|uniref:Uncharacterized protein n=1 Tax=Dryococelus australis TaxID=614101 RepID=A0ABQ9HWA2_9NEOP|nr:hypothetical protein PR048_008154 [Dryococelus australis]
MAALSVSPAAGVRTTLYREDANNARRWRPASDATRRIAPLYCEYRLGCGFPDRQLRRQPHCRCTEKSRSGSVRHQQVVDESSSRVANTCLNAAAKWEGLQLSRKEEPVTLVHDQIRLRTIRLHITCAYKVWLIVNVLLMFKELHTTRNKRDFATTKIYKESGASSLWWNFLDLVKLSLHEAEGYPGNRTLAELQKSANSHSNQVLVTSPLPLPVRVQALANGDYYVDSVTTAGMQAFSRLAKQRWEFANPRTCVYNKLHMTKAKGTGAPRGDRLGESNTGLPECGSSVFPSAGPMLGEDQRLAKTVREPRLAPGVYKLSCQAAAHEPRSVTNELREEQLGRDACRQQGRGGLVVRLLSSHLAEPGSIPGGAAPGFSRVGTVPDDSTSRRVSSGISRFLHPCIPVPLHTHLASPSPALKISILRAAQISPLQSK